MPSRRCAGESNSFITSENPILKITVLYPKEKFEGRDYILLVLQTVRLIGERFGLNHVVNVIRGSDNQYVRSYHHNELETYGKGKDEPDYLWKGVVRQVLVYEFLVKDIENIGVLKLSDKGIDFMENPYSVMLAKDHDFSTEPNEEEESERPASMSGGYDQNLFELLKGLRKDVARQKGLPPYVIFQDNSLQEMATTYPTTSEELAQVNGIGMGKVNKFGGEFLEVIRQYVNDNEITTAADVVVKSSVNKSKTKIFIIQQIDRKIDLEEIAETNGISFNSLLEEIENICYSGTKLNLDYYISHVMDEEKQDDLYDYFMNAETDSIDEALDDEDNQDYSEEEIRLMRIKFMSEYAN